MYLWLPIILSVLVVCCGIINDHQFSTSKQHPFISSQFCKSEVWHGWLGFLLRVSQGRNQGVGRTKILSGGSGGKNPLPSSFLLLAEFGSL